LIDDPKVASNSNRPMAGSEVVGDGFLPPAPTVLVPPNPPTLIFNSVVAELRRFVWGVIRDSALVDDVIQATYLKAVERGASAHPDTAKGWLFRVAYREALVVKRRDAARDRTTRRLATLPAREIPRPDEGLIRSEVVQSVRSAIETLSEPQRRVVLARMHGNQTFAEIAAESGLPLGTVLTHMRRALEKLRRVLDLGD